MAPKSKSGAIRSSIALALSRVKVYHQRAQTILRETPSTTEVSRHVNDIDTLHTKLQASIVSLKEKDDKWQTLILSLGDEEREDEDQLYNDTAYMSEESYGVVLEDAGESLSLLARAREKYQQSQSSTSATSSTVSATSTTAQNITRPHSAKLPKLQLPTFAGDYLQWDHFWSIFDTNVNKSSLTDSEKFAYLRAQLEGNAIDTIDGIAVCGDNYQTAITLLKTRFERRPEQMISTYYSQLMRLPASSGSVADMLKTYDACERIFRQLERAGEDIENNRASVLQLFSKFPSTVVKDLFSQFSVDSTAKLSELRVALNKYIRRSEDLGEIFADLKPYDATNSKQGRPKSDSTSIPAVPTADTTPKPTHITSTLGAAEPSKSSSGRSNSKPKSPLSPCYFCEGDHFNSQCSKYATATQRIDRMTVLGRCLRCMSTNHSEPDCRTAPQKVWCFFCKTNGSHPSALCKTKFDVKCSTTKVSASNEPAATTLLNSEERSILLTAVTAVTNTTTGSQLQLRLLLDSGSHRSYITDASAAALKLNGTSSDALNVAVFGTERTLSVATSQVAFSVQLRDGSFTLVSANTAPIITTCPVVPERLPEEVNRFITSMKYALADSYDGTGNDTVDILIGSDYLWEFITGPKISIPGGDLYLIPSSLGLLLGGRYKGKEHQKQQSVMLCLTDTTSPIQMAMSSLSACESSVTMKYPDIDAYWSLEKIGIDDNPIERDDDKALQQFNDTVKFEDGRYQVCWPWRADKSHSQLPTNYGLAYGRLVSTLKRFRKSDPTMLVKYQSIIDDQITKGVVEKVHPDEVKSSRYPIHYLPHHPIVKLSSATTKVRIVYDASSKSRSSEMSLNESLYRGPVLLPDLCSILLRFRLNQIAITADLEKAFLQMGLQVSERDVTRFLWLSDPTNPCPEDNIVVYRFLRVPFGVISSPFLLGATVQFHLNQDGSTIAIQIRDDTYVDNVITTVNNDEAAKEFYHAAKAIFAKAGMNLQEWSSNSSDLVQSIPDGDRGKIGDTKVLGLTWNTNDDTLRLSNDWSSKVACSTKRHVMKTTASIFDPLGFFQPCTLDAKCFLRKLWLEGCAWDDKLSETLQAEWHLIHSNVAPIFDVQIKRCIAVNNTSELVVFCDASINAYSTAVYVRTQIGDDPVVWDSNLVFSKTRLAPRQRSGDNVSLPRLELLGLTIGARAIVFARDALRSDAAMKAHLFTDSTCVLHWLQSPKPLATFVNNRIREVRHLVNVEFHHVSTSDNPADLGTRGLPGGELAECKVWWKGPQWLSDDPDSWPVIPAVQTVSDVDLQLIESEYSKQYVFHTIIAGEASGPDAKKPYPFGMDPSRYSSFQKLIRTTGWCLKFIQRLTNGLSPAVKASLASFHVLDKVSSGQHIEAEDIHQAKKMWLLSVQQAEYHEFINATRQSNHQLAKQLNVGFDNDGILRCFSRFKYADLPVQSLQPILLPKNHALTQLIIRGVHLKLFHGGVGHTLAQMRREFWVPQGRQAVRKILSRCTPCRKLKGQPFQMPRMPPWPKERLSRSTPFQYTGLDYLGPVNVTVNGTVQKMWIALFTCLAIRAVHLEWVSDCSAQTFLDCLIRFISRRGCPQQIISDNGAQFRASNSVTEAVWRTMLEDESVISYTSTAGIRWKFITALAPWQGGLYERLVGIVKQCFRSAVGRRLLGWDEFATLIAEVEAIVNSRPLTYVYEDFPSGFVLRPIDFITDLPVGRPTIPVSMRPEGGDAGKNLFRHWKYHQKRLDKLWEVWYDEYLLSLRERGHINHRGGRKDIQSEPNVNEVVVVKDSDAPRGNWKLGRVVRLIKGDDHVVRSAEVLLPNKMTIQRSVHHLYPLEVDSIDAPIDDATADGISNNSDTAVDPDTAAPDDAATQTNDDEDGFDGFEQSDVDEVRIRLGLPADNDVIQSNIALRARDALGSGFSEMAMFAVVNYQ